MFRARWRCFAVQVFALAAAVTSARSLGAQGTIAGRITNEAGSPLPETRVIVISGTASAVTGADGKYVLRNLAAGPITLQALHVGSQSVKKTVTVAGKDSFVVVDFVMKQAIVQLDEIVTTATGQQRKVELGNAIATLGDVGKNVEQTTVTRCRTCSSPRRPACRAAEPGASAARRRSAFAASRRSR